MSNNQLAAMTVVETAVALQWPCNGASTVSSDCNNEQYVLLKEANNYPVAIMMVEIAVSLAMVPVQ